MFCSLWHTDAYVCCSLLWLWSILGFWATRDRIQRWRQITDPREWGWGTSVATERPVCRGSKETLLSGCDKGTVQAPEDRCMRLIVPDDTQSSFCRWQRISWPRKLQSVSLRDSLVVTLWNTAVHCCSCWKINTVNNYSNFTWNV